MNSKTQKEKVLNRLLKGKTLTPLQALRLYDSLRLGAIVHKLRETYYISTTFVNVGRHKGKGKHVARYAMEGER